MNDEQYFLANAYLDGELTGVERRSAEADPDVMSEVEQLRLLQARVRSFEPPLAATREAAIAAAMTGFGSVSIAPQRSSTTTVMEFRRRRWSTRYLGFAAGFVAIGLLGTVVVTSLSGGGDDDAASKLAGDEPTAALAVEQSSDQILESSEAAATADAAGSAETELAPAAEQPVAEAAQAPVDEAASDSADTVVAAGRPQIDPAQPLTTPAELGAFGSYLVELQQAGQLPPTPNTKCSQAGIMGSTQYVFDNVSVEVLVAVDETTRTTTAIDPDTCGELLVGPLF